MRAFTLMQCTWLAVIACGGTTAADGSNDSGPATHEAGPRDSTTPCGGSITFDLAVDAPGLVYYGGPQPPWPTQNTCASWLTIDHAGEALLLGKGICNIPCVRAQPQDAGAQSLRWDGTYYPIDTSAGGPGPGQCVTPACAPPGNYVATFCVSPSLGDASWQEGPPTCKTVSFVWPPSTPDQVISETITPAPDGG
jgi:hypothetical protein